MSEPPTLTALRIADPADRWEALGFTVVAALLDVGPIRLVLGGDGSGITEWSLPAVDGLLTMAPNSATTAAAFAAHPNGAIGIDHVVVLTPDFDRTAAALDQAGLPLKRVRDAGGFRQGFRRVGAPILELVEEQGADPANPARFWGLVFVVADLDALKTRLGDLLSDPRPAVQQGRRIATLRDRAGLSPKVAFMDPEPEGGTADGHG